MTVGHDFSECCIFFALFAFADTDGTRRKKTYHYLANHLPKLLEA